MRRAVLLLILFLCASAQAQNFRTTRFDSSYEIKPNGVVSVTETISLEFLVEQRGLIRKLPFSTKGAEGQTRVVRYSNVNVQIDRGSGFGTAEIRESNEGGDLHVRI